MGYTPASGNMSSFPVLDFFEAMSAELLKEQLLQINMPAKIVAIYKDGNKHVAWVSLTRPVKKRILKNTDNEDKGIQL